MRYVFAGSLPICLLLAGCGRGGAPPVAAASAPVVGVVAVARRNLARTLQLAAEFKAYQDITVNAKVAGYVKQINVDVGDHVRAGQLLAVLEVPELEDQLREAAAAVTQDAQNIARAQDLEAQAQATQDATHLAYTRLNQVLQTQPGLVAQQEVDDAHSKDEAAAAQVEAARAALAGAQAQQSEAQANQRRLETMLAYSRITAPFDGVITQRFADTGAMIQAGTAQAMPVVRLAQEDVLRLGIPVPETEVPRIHLGTEAQVFVNALGQTFAGKVARFSDLVEFDTRTMYTEIDVPNPRGVLVPGMYAQATLTLDQRHGTLAVPVQALTRLANGGATVMLVNPRHELAVVPVSLGLETPDWVEVTHGLAPGDQVVLGGGSLLHAGEAVQPKPIAPPSAAAAAPGAS